MEQFHSQTIKKVYKSEVLSGGISCYETQAITGYARMYMMHRLGQLDRLQS